MIGETVSLEVVAIVNGVRGVTHFLGIPFQSNPAEVHRYEDQIDTLTANNKRLQNQLFRAETETLRVAREAQRFRADSDRLRRIPWWSRFRAPIAE